jgi:phosphatidylserine/phosphatidylglycerophosphate/cardiolipin synthase-like enzyme
VRIFAHFLDSRLVVIHRLTHKLWLTALCVSLAAPVLARDIGWRDLLRTNSTTSAPSSTNIEVGFSPDAGAEELVVKTIHSAHQSLRVLAYSFTSRPIAQALIDAAKRGVDVRVVVDKSNKSERYTSATFLANTGIPVRVDSEHAIAHNKVIIADGQTVETGSFNYTSSAAHRNAENAIVIWNNPTLAAIYLKNWDLHWRHSDAYQARY